MKGRDRGSLIDWLFLLSYSRFLFALSFILFATVSSFFKPTPSIVDFIGATTIVTQNRK